MEMSHLNRMKAYQIKAFSEMFTNGSAYIPHKRTKDETPTSVRKANGGSEANTAERREEQQYNRMGCKGTLQEYLR